MLFVCTANQCRSPLAAALLSQRLAQAGYPGRVRSAGLLGGGQRATGHSVAVAAARGVDLSGHTSAALDDVDVEQVDLVLGMTRAHVREVVARWPHLWPRAFTYRELVRRGTGVGPRQPDESVAAWLERVGEDRPRRDLLGSSPLDDIADPVHLPEETYEQLARELAHLADRLVGLLWPS